MDNAGQARDHVEPMAAFWFPYDSGVALVGTVGLVVKAGAGLLRRMSGQNTHATVEYYLVLVNKATPPVNGDAVVDALRLPPALVSSLQAIPPMLDYTDPKQFSLGISIALSTTPHLVTLGTAVAHFSGDWV